MRKPNASCASVALVTLAALTLGACAKKEEPAPVAALPPPPPPPAPPPPSADDQLSARLTALGAVQSDAGWKVTLTSAKSKGRHVAFDADDEATITKIVTLMKDDSHLRVQVEDYIEKRGPKARVQELSQMHANAVMRDLTAAGGDEVRIQAEGRVDTSSPPRTEIIFSNAEGEFRPAPVQNS